MTDKWQSLTGRILDSYRERTLENAVECCECLRAAQDAAIAGGPEELTKFENWARTNCPDVYIDKHKVSLPLDHEVLSLHRGPMPTADEFVEQMLEDRR